MTTPYQEFENAWKQWRDLSISSWSGMAQQMVENDTIAQSMAASYDWGLEMQRRMRESTQTYLQTLDVPTGEDLARLSRQIVSAEGRVLDCEEQVDALRTRVAAAESAAREAKAEAAALRARLDTLEQSSGKGTPTQTTRRRKTP